MGRCVPWCSTARGRRCAPAELPEPVPGPGQVLLDVRACGVCRTDLHVLRRRGPRRRARRWCSATRSSATRADTGERVGVPWLGWTDGTCAFCTRGQENLCPAARFTGKDIDGGFAERTVADERFCLAAAGGPRRRPRRAAAVRRADRAPGAARGRRPRARSGLYGFGAAAHIVCQVALWEGREVYAFTRPGDERDPGVRPRAWARRGRAGPTSGRPEPLDAALIFAPAGELVPAALRAVRPRRRRRLRRAST